MGADGKPLAMMEANYLGQIRTGAASGYATKLLSRPESAILGVIGSGFQARTQIASMRAVRAIREVRIWSRSEEKRRELAQESGSIAVDTAEQAVRDADIVVTATNAKDPVLDPPGFPPELTSTQWVEPSQRRELPADLILRADLIAVDSLEQARMESGDLLLALDPESSGQRILSWS